jgi:hypothetical protein
LFWPSSNAEQESCQLPFCSLTRPNRQIRKED